MAAAPRTPKRRPDHRAKISSGTLGALTPPPHTSNAHAPKLSPQKSPVISNSRATGSGDGRDPFGGFTHVSSNGANTSTAIALPAHQRNQVWKKF